MFIDEIKIKVSAGKGGDGCVSFRKEKYVPKGGPDGGTGGNGGDVILKVSDTVSSLSHLYYIPQFKAPNGQHGKGKNLYGKEGDDLIINIPPGTVVYKLNEKREKILLGDLIACDEILIVAKGGKGGKGNTRFKSSTNRVPRIRELGKLGESLTLLLELKLIADIGLVGYPNAGKSTLLTQISNAKPKIASYPFTTLTPNLGVLQLGESLSRQGGISASLQQLTVADIPGIIEEAHKGKGLGLKFLRHIERTRMLIFVLDITRDYLTDYKTLKNEIREYNPLILKKPSLIVINKIDLIETMDVRGTKSLGEVILISALKGDGINNLFSAIKTLLK